MQKKVVEQNTTKALAPTVVLCSLATERRHTVTVPLGDGLVHTIIYIIDLFDNREI
jgi:hypothetical protein